ncbi:hypothetical protein HOH11_01175 [Candidatus Woesearchaeota archaeon]|nr:hypothetical protein [Candidatus Woesearchaeota archaeon]MBT6023197.1 hypothetical protein [Candidatus Woesearchaeota archaeon]
MRLLNKIEEARKKLTFAEYLLSQDKSEDFAVGAMKHILDAAKLTLQELTQFNSIQIESKAMITQHFNKLHDTPYKDFHRAYFKMIDSEYNSLQVSTNALKTVKDFVNQVEENRQIK